MSGNKVLVIIGGILLVLCLYAVSSYNGLASAREEVATRSSDIGAQLQRRMDLIPNLVASVKRFTEHESSVIDKVVKARAQLAGAQSMTEKADADAALSGALKGLMVIVENYPQLKSDTVYVGLMDELAGTENRIAVSRKAYNEAVRAYNTEIITFPTNILAGAMGFAKADYFQARPEAANVPDVGSLL